MDAYTSVHVILSVVGILSGLVVVGGMLANRILRGWTVLFLATTVATNATGFGFPFKGFLPSHGIAAISLVALALAVVALYVHRLAGRCRAVYVITAVLALYFNVFVLIVQAFLKVPLLNALAPNQHEPPFAITQLAALAIFVILGVQAFVRFRDPSEQAAPAE